uniref:Uncharacterized protein n=1 Tax=Megaselia scalaris TaxID=36166 RepID=T1GNP2_MEGSC
MQFGLPDNQHDDDDKYLDVVGTQSPLKTSIQRMHLPQQSALAAWFNHLAGSCESSNNENAYNETLQVDDNDKDGSDSSCSESNCGNSAFKPAPGSPKSSASSYPSPNISVGPPIQPPHLLPYLYPHGLYNSPHLPMLQNSATSPMPQNLLFNAHLALASQHQVLFGNYSGHSSAAYSLQNLKGNRFAPYNLPGSIGSAFDAVTPTSKINNSNSNSMKIKNCDSDINIHEDGSRSSSPLPICASSNTSPARPNSISPKSASHEKFNESSSCSSELKNIENIVNCLESHPSKTQAPIKFRILNIQIQKPTDICI